MKTNSLDFISEGQFLIVVFFLLLSAGCGPSAFRNNGGLVTNKTDWPAFISRQDPVWEKLPENFDEGAFLVSAARKDGVTQWVRIKSLAGEPCRVNPGMTGDVSATVPLKNQGNGVYELYLPAGGEALLFTGSEPPSAVIEPIAADPAKINFWGVK